MIWQGRLFLILFLFLFIKQLSAQSFNYIHYTTFDGLPSQVVYSVIQDHDGFMWFGTSNGLCRFDGKNFKTFTTDDGLPDNEVLQLYQDKKGRIWLSLFNGGACYFYKGKFHTQENDSALAKITGIKSFTNYYFPKNEPWFVIYGGKKTYTLSDNIEIIATYNEYEYGRSSSFPFPDRNILFTSKRLVEFKNGIVIKATEPIWHKPINYIKATLTKTILNRNYFLDLETKLLELTIFKDDNSYTTHYIKNYPYQFEDMLLVDSLIYVTTTNSVLLRYHLKDSLFRSPEILLKGKTFNRVYKDKEGGLWITSIDDGVYYIPTEVPKIYNEKSGLVDNGIYSVFEFNKLVYFSDSKGNIYQSNPFKKVMSLGDNSIVFRIRQVVSDNRFIYMATDRSIFKADIAAGKFKRLFRNNSAKDIIKPEAFIYYASGGGLFKMNSEGLFNDTLSVGRKTSVAMDSESNLWYGELNGLYKINSKGAIVDFGAINQLLKTRIIAIKNSADGILWVATQANGLIGLEKDSVKYIFNKSNGLSTNNLKSICINKDFVCVATDKGIDLFNYKEYENNNSVKHIKKFNGLASDDVNCVLIKNDTLYAGTSQGFSIIPLNFKPNRVPPSVLINDVEVNNQPINTTKDLSFAYNYNNVTINYTGISYQSAGNINYRYRLFTYEPWTETKLSSITLAELAPGDYHFEVDAQNASGYWSNKPAAFVFTIEPPFWKRIRFIAGASFLAAGLIALAYYYRLKKFRKDLQIENRMLQSEIKALRAQMNPHFLFNSLNSIQQFIFSNKKEEANEFLSKFAKLMRMMLDHSQENFITVAEEIDFITLYLELEEHRLSNRFEYVVNFNDKNAITRLYIPSMVLQPFIENAILHGIAPSNKLCKLTIDFALQNNNLTCTIIDDGVGRKEGGKNNTLHAPFGISATRNRIKAINLAHAIKVKFKIIDLSIEQHQTTGTQVVIEFPEVTQY